MLLIRRDLIFGATGAFVGAFPLAAAAAERLSLRSWPGDNGTSVAIEMEKKRRFTVSTLRDRKGTRFIVDIQGLRLTKALSRAAGAAGGRDRFLAGVRVGQYKPDILRVVFELKGSARASAHYAAPAGQYAHRIIVNITGTADPMQTTVKNTEGSRTAGKSQAVGKQKVPAAGTAESSRVRSGQQSGSQAAPRKESSSQARKSAGKETLIVVIDPGHGGEDPGAVGRRKTYEKTVVLAIAKKLAGLINSTRGMKAVLTRNRDVFIPLARRAGIAVSNRAHLFISIHADAWTNPKATGSSVFTLSEKGASSLQARWLAQTQNRSDEIGGVGFKDVAAQARSTVVDMLAETKLRYGIQLGDEVLAQLSRLGKLHKATVEYANFAVLKAQGIPSILVETAFLSNPEEEQRLRNARHQAAIANAIFVGVCNAVRKDPSLLRQS